MAHPIPNDAGFLIIQMANYEIAAVMDNFAYCDLCGISEGIQYYIPYINQIYCEKCYLAWLSGAKRYKDGIKNETTRYNRIKAKLQALEVWDGES